MKASFIFKLLLVSVLALLTSCSDDQISTERTTIVASEKASAEKETPEQNDVLALQFIESNRFPADYRFLPNKQIVIDRFCEPYDLILNICRNQNLDRPQIDSVRTFRKVFARIEMSRTKNNLLSDCKVKVDGKEDLFKFGLKINGTRRTLIVYTEVIRQIGPGEHNLSISCDMGLSKRVVATRRFLVIPFSLHMETESGITYRSTAGPVNLDNGDKITLFWKNQFPGIEKLNQTTCQVFNHFQDQPIASGNFSVRKTLTVNYDPKANYFTNVIEQTIRLKLICSNPYYGKIEDVGLEYVLPKP